MDKIISLAKGVDKETVCNLLDRVENNAYQVDDIIEKLVNKYCSELDELMKKVKDIV